MLKKLIIITIILFLAVMLGASLHEINKHDLSVQKAATCNLKEKGPIYLITYGDGEAYVSNTKVLAESALNNCIDVVYMYRKEHLDKDFVEKNKKIFEAKRGSGYWLWKPYLTLKTLEQMPENSIMIYFDSGIKIINPLDHFINELGDNDMMLVDNFGLLNKEYIKRDLFRIMNMDNEVARNAQQLNGAMFVVRNTTRSREFVRKWLDIAQIDGAITNDPSIDEYPEFIEHRHDQSILSLLYLQDPKGIKIAKAQDVMEDVYLHRRRGQGTSLFLFDYNTKNMSSLTPSFGGYRAGMPILERVLYEMLRIERLVRGW